MDDSATIHIHNTLEYIGIDGIGSRATMKNPTQAAGPRLLCLAIVFIATLTGAEAFAQRFLWQWSPRVSASEQYDDNVFLTTDDKTHDWITFLTPGLTLSLMTEETEDSLATLSYDFSLVKYATNDELSEIRHYLTLSTFQGIPFAKRLTLALNGSLRISEDPFDIIDVAQDVTRTAGGRYYSSDLGGRVDYFFGPENSVYAGFTHRMLLNEEPGVEDRREYLPTAGFNYWFNRRYGFAVDYSYSKADFDVSDNYEEHLAIPSALYRISPRTEANVTYTYDGLDYDGPRLGYTAHTFTLGLSHQFSGRTMGSISGGYLLIVPEQGDNSGNFSGSLLLTHSRQRLSCTLDAASGYRRQFFETENLGLSLFTRASLTFTYQLQERLSALLRGSYSRDEYQETIADREDSTWRGGVGLDYVFLRWLNGGILYEYRQRVSDIDVDEYVDNRATVRFTATYSGRPRPL